MDGREAVQVEVADDGPGMPQEVADHVFDPFFTTKAKGSGLGLADRSQDRRRARRADRPEDRARARDDDSRDAADQGNDEE